MLDLNLRSALLPTQAAARAMIEGGNGGRVLHISSVRGQLGIDNGFSAYVAAKGALDALTRQQATEWAKHDITVNAISPTFVMTPQVEDLLADDAFREGLYKRIPLGPDRRDRRRGRRRPAAVQRRVGLHHRPGAHARRRTHRVPVTDAPFTRSNLREQIKDVILQRILERRLLAGRAAGGDADRAGAGRLAGAGARGAARPRAARLHRPRAVPRLLGARVLAREELLEAFPVRAALEALAARLAAERITRGRAAAAGRAAGPRCAAPRQRGDAHDQSQANASFHATIVRAARNATLERQWSFLEPFSRTYISVSQPGLDLRAMSERHVPILEALRARDGDAAAEAMHTTSDGRRRTLPERSSLETHRRPLHAGPPDMLTFPRVPPPALCVYESHTEFAERIGAAEYGVDSLTASYLVVQNDHVGSPGRAQAHRPDRRRAGDDPARVLLLGRRAARLHAPRARGHHQRRRHRGRAGEDLLRGQGARHRPHPHRRRRVQHRGALPHRPSRA